LSFEVDYDIFAKKFWHTVRVNGNLSPLAVWTEIYSNIKGSVNSHKFVDLVLPVKEYSELSEKKTFLNSQLRTVVYNIFLQYERWKRQQNGFDFMDVINYILSNISAVSTISLMPLAWLPRRSNSLPHVR
jgi:hypothetical protein